MKSTAKMERESSKSASIALAEDKEVNFYQESHTNSRIDIRQIYIRFS